MKKPPTLADICVASALDKRTYKGNGLVTRMMKDILLKVPYARKFVLDDDMSEFLAELHDGVLSGGLRKRNVTLDNVRRLSRLPHHLTWIEFNYPKFFDRLRYVKKYEIMGLDRNHAQPNKLGWLLEQHPTNAAAFRRIEIWNSVQHDGVAFMHPGSMAWCADDEPSPWQRWPADYETSEACTVQGYHSMQAHLIATFTPETSYAMMDEICRGYPEEDLDFVTKNATTLRTVWPLLATINDLPVRMEVVEPTHGFMARGNYRKFLKHSIVHLTVPESRWRKLVLKSAEIIRKRAHQVRGHWRNDWRNPPSPQCDHVWGYGMVCKKCGGRKLWILEHQRGDTSLGFVTHDYAVHHKDNI